MSQKPLSVGVKAALIGGAAIIIAAILSLVAPLISKQSPAVSQSANNSQGVIQAARDVVIQQNGNQSTSSKYDTALIKSYDDKFEHMTKRRELAAIAILEYLSKGNWNSVTNNTDALDEVLGFFDTLGYDEEHGLVDPDVVHEYFCDDILAYYQVSQKYIEAIQKTDPTEYVHIKPLYETVRKIESEKPPKIRPDEVYFIKPELVKLFQSETNAVNLQEDK